METETLERLLMDRALGELSPDAETLLAAYLEHDAVAAARGREFELAAIRTRQVLRQAQPTTLPPFPAARMQALNRGPRRLVLLRNVAGIAAALVLGVALGAGLDRHVAAQRTAGASPLPAPVFVIARMGAEATGSAGFWSVQRLYERARDAKRTQATQLIWDSPVEAPTLGGKS
jgi:anti-sigma factor RsiW